MYEFTYARKRNLQFWGIRSITRTYIQSFKLSTFSNTTRNCKKCNIRPYKHNTQLFVLYSEARHNGCVWFRA